MTVECSIIIPAYNAEKNIKSLLDSISSYHSDNHFEVIVVDDGSSDLTAKIVRESTKSNPFIRLIEKENGGVSSARNVGIHEATGKYLFFADADDEIHMYALEHAVLKNKIADADIVIADYETHNLMTGELQKVDVGIPYDTVMDKTYIQQELFARIIKGHNDGLSCVWNKVFRSEIIKNNTLCFDENRTYGEDWEFVIHYLKCSRTLLAINEIIYSYQLDGTQVFSKYRKHLGYCLISGYQLEEGLKSQYKIIYTQEEVMQSRSRTAGQFLDFLLLPKVSKQEKTEFLKDEHVKEVFSFVGKVRDEDLPLIGYSRRDKLVFRLLSIGMLRIPLKLLQR